MQRGDECVKHRNGKNMPQDAKILEWHGFLGFPTRIRYQLTDMEEVEWVSRQQRKRRRLPFAGRTRGWWESERISQWMCVLFMIGSFAFTLGALLCFDLSLPVIIPAVIFFVGSLFFTSAAYLQFLEAINVPGTSAQALAGGTNRAIYFAWEPDRIDWWSTITQFIGTLYFNFSTFNAMRMNLSLTKIDRLVWSADFLGSILFLVSSSLAYGEVASALTNPKRKESHLVDRALKSARLCRIRNFSNHILYSSQRRNNDQCERDKSYDSSRRCVFLCWRIAATH